MKWVAEVDVRAGMVVVQSKLRGEGVFDVSDMGQVFGEVVDHQMGHLACCCLWRMAKSTTEAEEG